MPISPCVDSFVFMCLYFVCFFHTAYLSYYCNTVGWTCWDWSLILRTPSYFGALTLLVGSFDLYKPVPDMTYNLFGGTLNLTQLVCKQKCCRHQLVLSHHKTSEMTWLPLCLEWRRVWRPCVDRPALGRVTAEVDRRHPTALSVAELEAFWLSCSPHLHTSTSRYKNIHDILQRNI